MIKKTHMTIPAFVFMVVDLKEVATLEREQVSTSLEHELSTAQLIIFKSTSEIPFSAVPKKMHSISKRIVLIHISMKNEILSPVFSERHPQHLLDNLSTQNKSRTSIQISNAIKIMETVKILDREFAIPSRIVPYLARSVVL